MWERHLPAKWKDRAPRLVHKEDGSDVWVFEGKQIPNVGLNAVAGRAPEEYGMEPTALSQLRPGCYDIDARIGDMNANGVLGSLCFPSVPGFVGELFGRQAKAGKRELAIAMLRAYNDWHIDEWCGKYPGRFIPLAIPPIWDPELMGREVRRVAKKGCHAITFADTPGGLGYPSLHSEHWDPFWKACADEGTVVCIHIGSGTGMNLQDPIAPVEIMIATTPASLLNCATELVFSPIFPKFPALKVALSEGGIGWIPYFLERIDYVHEPPSRLDAPRVPRRQEAQRRLPRARDRLLHRRRGRRAQPRPDRRRQHHLGVRLPALRLDLAERARDAVALAHRRPGRRHPQDHLAERRAPLPVRPVQAHPEGEVHGRRAARPGEGRRPDAAAQRPAASRPPTTAAATPRSATS